MMGKQHKPAKKAGFVPFMEPLAENEPKSECLLTPDEVRLIMKALEKQQDELNYFEQFSELDTLWSAWVKLGDALTELDLMDNRASLVKQGADPL